MSPRVQKWLISGPPLVYLLIFFAIPIVVGVLTLRKKPEQAVSFNEPLPPAA